MQSDQIKKISAFVKVCRDKANEMACAFEKDGFQSEKKPDKTWVTEADLSIEKELRKMIAAEFPDHHVLGEEEGGTFEKEGVTWILDPIDGTFSFVNRVPFYSSLIAVCVDGVPVIGSASLPSLGWTLFAQKEGGCFFNNEKISAESRGQTATSDLISIADPYRFRMTDNEKLVDSLLGDPFKTRVYPDALGYMMLVRGAIRCFVDPRTEIWDTAPFHVILPEAGLRIRNWDGSDVLKKGGVISDSPSFPADDVWKLITSDQ